MHSLNWPPPIGKSVHDIAVAENEPPMPGENAPDPEGEKSAVDPLDAVRQIAAQ